MCGTYIIIYFFVVIYIHTDTMKLHDCMIILQIHDQK